VKRFSISRVLPTIIAPVAAILLAAGISSLILLNSGKDPLSAFQAMFKFAFAEPFGPESMVDILNRATSYYLAAIAVAIGFRMGLFNIGVDGQYRLAGVLAGALGAASFLSALPGVLRILIMMITAVVVGAAWAAIAGLLKVTRGVSEVISTIMLNAIAGGFVAYLLTTDRLGVQPKGSNSVSTKLLPKDSWMPGIPLIAGSNQEVYGFIVIAALVGVLYWFVLGRTRFGFDLRASGLNPFAAVASGVDAKRMVVYTMLASGAVAGLVGLPDLLGQYHAYTSDFGGLGFTGIAIALLGRNHPVGIAFGSLLWAFLDQSAQILDLNEIPKETVTIMQGTTVLAVVVAYELAARLTRRVQQRRVGVATGEAVPEPVPVATVPAAPAAGDDQDREVGR
jgi:general nucleoside transport system permease protein